jgi:pimeloyl-ACP methyl ester carboxylesterase
VNGFTVGCNFQSHHEDNGSTTLGTQAPTAERKPAPKSTTWSDPSPHKSGFVSANGIRINYLDFGGSGPTLILIHGLGYDPHIFDDLAPAFTDRFHVVAYARRGHGDSEAKEPFNTIEFTEDLRGLMDVLGIKKAHLAGWSMGGNEITEMAGKHPERVNRIVYLDSAFDWGDPVFVQAVQQAPPVFLSVPASAFKSLDAYLARERTVTFPSLSDTHLIEACIRDLLVIQPDGSVQLKTSEATGQALFNALLTDRRDYTKVHAPALAIYAESMRDVHNGGEELRELALEWERKYMDPFRAASVERIRRELPNVEVVNVPGTHMDFFFRSRQQVVAAMRRFLSEPDKISE